MRDADWNEIINEGRLRESEKNDFKCALNINAKECEVDLVNHARILTKLMKNGIAWEEFISSGLIQKYSSKSNNLKFI